MAAVGEVGGDKMMEALGEQLAVGIRKESIVGEAPRMDSGKVEP